MDLKQRSRRTALVTGVYGFVGRHLAARLRESGTTVVGIDLLGTDRVDLLDAPRVAQVVREHRPDRVFHLGGLLRGDPRAVYDANVDGTLHILEAVAIHAPRAHVVVVSSSAVYGTRDEGALDEDRALRPSSHYGASKVAQEAVALRYHTASDMRVMVARPFNVVGPGQPVGLAAGAFASQIAAAERVGGGDLHVGDLSATRDFVDVRDVARALCIIAEAGRGGGVYNVCTGEGTSMEDCVDAFVRKSRVPVRMVRAAGAPKNGHDRQVGCPRRVCADTGWRPEVDLHSSIEDLLEFYRSSSQEGAS